MGETLIHERVEAAEQGQNPMVICRMLSGYLVLCDRQSPRGWSILLSVPVVSDLEVLDPQRQAEFLSDMAAAGRVLKEVTGAYRINYSIFGNAEPALHAHIQPRFATEPEALRRQPLWAIGKHLETVPFDLERDAPLMAATRRGLAASGRCT